MKMKTTTCEHLLQAANDDDDQARRTLCTFQARTVKDLPALPACLLLAISHLHSPKTVSTGQIGLLVVVSSATGENPSLY